MEERCILMAHSVGFYSRIWVNNNINDKDNSSSNDDIQRGRRASIFFFLFGVRFCMPVGANAKQTQKNKRWKDEGCVLIQGVDIRVYCFDLQAWTHPPSFNTHIFSASLSSHRAAQHNDIVTEETDRVTPTRKGHQRRARKGAKEKKRSDE
jgi:hypothetical protein